MDADILYHKIVELVAIKPAYKEGTGVAVDSLALHFQTTANEVLTIAQQLELAGKVTIQIDTKIVRKRELKRAFIFLS